MSTLVVGAINSTTTSPPTIQNTNGTEIGRLCRAWVNFNGTGTVAINAQFNVSSITDNGTGDYTVNFTNAMPDANYAVAGTAQNNTTSGTGGADLNVKRSTDGFAAGSTRLITYGSSTETSLDCVVVSVAIFR